MSIMFLNDARVRPVGRQAASAVTSLFYALAALAVAVAAPLALSFAMGGMAPMLILSVYLLPLAPILALLTCGGWGAFHVASARRRSLCQTF